MPLQRSGLVDLLMERVPEAKATIQQHLDDNEHELLFHLLTADLRRLAITWFEHRHYEPLGRLLQVVETGLQEGDEDVENAIAVSFIEDSGWWDPTTEPFTASWPPGLQDELERQRRTVLTRPPADPGGSVRRTASGTRPPADPVQGARLIDAEHGLARCNQPGDPCRQSH